jgi:hypothetical protein
MRHLLGLNVIFFAEVYTNAVINAFLRRSLRSKK